MLNFILYVIFAILIIFALMDILNVDINNDIDISN